MLYFSYIKHGFGNKILIFLYLIDVFKKRKGEKLYLVQEKSYHEKGLVEDNFTYIFPKLKDIKWLQFIDWTDYDVLKENENAKEITYDLFDWLNSDYIIQYKSFIKKYMSLNETYDKLLDNYDVKNGIAIHVRYGDKLEINKTNIRKKMYPKYLLLTPEYYIENCNRFLKEKSGPIYIFTDSESIVKKTILPLLPNAIIADEPYQHVFYLLTKFRRQIISDSTLSASAGYFNNYKHVIIAPYFFSYPSIVQNKKADIIKSPYFDKEVFQLDKNKEYITFTV